MVAAALLSDSTVENCSKTLDFSLHVFCSISFLETLSLQCKLMFLNNNPMLFYYLLRQLLPKSVQSKMLFPLFWEIGMLGGRLGFHLKLSFN